MNKPARKLKFEDAMRRLDAIVAAMEAGDIGIEESIGQYEEAMELAAHCRRILESAEQRIRKIQFDSSGQLKAEPFEDAAPRDAEDDASPEAS